MNTETIQIHKKETSKNKLLEDITLPLELGLEAIRAGKVKRVRHLVRPEIKDDLLWQLEESLKDIKAGRVTLFKPSTKQR
ncbi:hypothetical protein C4580_01650 [Candidatus Woesearchaeota archaeon]|nr:MAG: hypothetical protein C4580_01650 [Candidatus Woesearchaeota archaeon]